MPDRELSSSWDGVGRQRQLVAGERVGRFVVVRDIDGRTHAIAAGSVAALCQTDEGTLVMLPGGKMVHVQQSMEIVLNCMDGRPVGMRVPALGSRYPEMSRGYDHTPFQVVHHVRSLLRRGRPRQDVEAKGRRSLRQIGRRGSLLAWNTRQAVSIRCLRHQPFGGGVVQLPPETLRRRDEDYCLRELMMPCGGIMGPSPADAQTASNSRTRNQYSSARPSGLPSCCHRT